MSNDPKYVVGKAVLAPVVMPHVSAFDDNFLGDGKTKHILPNPNDSIIKRTSQERVASWLKEAIGYDKLMDVDERNHRTLEEAAELVQASGLSRGAAHQIIDMVYDKPVGNPRQEVAGLLVCLLAHAESMSIDTNIEFEREMERIWDNIDVIREKNQVKPRFAHSDADPVRWQLIVMIKRLMRYVDPGRAAYQDALVILDKVGNPKVNED